MKNSIKKIGLILTLVSTTVIGNSQNNLFQELEQYKTEEFKKYEFHYSSTDEIMKISDRGYNDVYKNCVVFIQRNEFGKPLDLEIQESNGNNKPEDYSVAFRHTIYDHYSEPAFISADFSSADTYMMIDGVLFQIENGNDDMSSYKYGYAYVPLSIVNKKTEKKEKDEGTKEKSKGLKAMKAKLEAKLAQPVGFSIPDALNNLKNKEDYKEMIDTYLTEMRAKQAKNPINANDKKEIAAMKLSGDEEKAAINKANSDYWNSEEGQRVLNKGESNNSYTIVNTSSKTVEVITGTKTMYVSAGGSASITCNNAVYFAVKNGSSTEKGSLISSGSNVCGKSINF